MIVKTVEGDYRPKDTDEVRCNLHNFITTWGALDTIQKLAVASGLDTDVDSPCICEPRNVN